jgi:hypothetical protein
MAMGKSSMDEESGKQSTYRCSLSPMHEMTTTDERRNEEPKKSYSSPTSNV